MTSVLVPNTRTKYEMVFDFTDGKAHYLTLYFLDWDEKNRIVDVEFYDAVTGSTLALNGTSFFIGGKYLTWRVQGKVKVVIGSAFSDRMAVLSGVFVDPVTPSPTPTPTPTPTMTPSPTPAPTPTPNLPPVANDDSVAVVQDGGWTVVDVLANDHDPEGGTLTFLDISRPANGTAESSFNNTRISYMPDPGFVGVDSFTYKIVDNKGATDTATVSVTASAPVHVEIRGRVMAGSGRWAGRALVILDGPDGRRYATANTFGFFRFQGGAAGRTYRIGVAGKRPGFGDLRLTPTADLADLIITVQP